MSQALLFDDAPAGDDGIRRGAVFSPCRRYRYTLERKWDDVLPMILFVLLNPSTADAKKDDNTNKRGMSFARAWGYGECVFVNLFAFRTSKPAEMKKAEDPIGPMNDAILFEWRRRSDTIVLAWGIHGPHLGRDREVLKLFKNHKRGLFTLGLTKDGHPKHPLYLPKTTKLQVWEDKR